MEEAPLPFLDTWNQWAQIVAGLLAALAVITLLTHLFKLATTGDPKTKYDFINKSEISVLWTFSLMLVFGAAIFANSFLAGVGLMWLIIRLFVSLVLSVIILVVIRNLLKFYYPFYMEKRLKALRYRPRISPKTGKPMKLLSEEEEDVYLDEGMQAEEEIFSIDYDVWIDEESGYTQIEKYSGHLHALKCPECDYQTFKIVKEEILRNPTPTVEGELTKFFECGYCGFKEARNVRVAPMKDPASRSKSTAAPV
ncbi:MAG TPA: hypothetical protein VGA21_08330 [Cyclobacteriaceae bacterium]|jgi:hypothetical protein